MTFFVDKQQLIHIQEQLCCADDDYKIFTINKYIEEYNSDLYDSAVAYVATSTAPILLLVHSVEVEQIRRVNDPTQIASVRTRNALVSWSDVAAYIRANNKQCGNDPIPFPFMPSEYMLLNIYGANLIKTPIPRTYVHDLQKLIKLNNNLKCFLSNSNNALEKQLDIIFDIISDKSQISVDAVKARKYNSKLVRMEYIKYSSLIQNISVVDIDRLIDLIIRQYIHVLTQGTITATSMMDIHKAQTPSFEDGAQALSINNGLLTHKPNDHYRIVQKTATTNPYFYSMLCSERRKTKLGIDIDYTIDNLVQILSENSLANSMRLWNTLIEYGEHGNSKFSACKHTSHGVLSIESYCEIAMYAPNGSSPIEKCPSTLVYLLQKNAWLPDKDGNLFKPADILTEELDDNFLVNNNNLLMAALQIGANR